ncbi:MAG: patatin-like phospholipase family protein [Burkholderiales bacterium]|nr:MAG: patatin [Pseudomonadota bacterium]MCZ2413472.1 patatin-like phospholipase family protein [Burkholderiales bacterium]ODS99061.1 MAG: patatin [Lautropia sp. SCN 69-89]
MSADPEGAEPTRRVGERRRIGVALGSGSARGLAHIGVMRALVEAGVDVDVVAGTSMGAFVGAIFAAGKLDRLEADFRGFDWASIAALLDPVFPRSGLIDGRRIGDFMRSQVAVERVEDLPIPFRAIATDIGSGETVAIDRGDLIAAVRASIAVPGIFTPVRSDGRILVDGGLVEPVPVSAARALGADLVIAVDLNHDIVLERSARVAQESAPGALAQAVTQVLANFDSLQLGPLAQFREWLERDPLPGIFEVLLASIYIMQARITQATLERDRPEILIQPALGSVRFMAFDRAEEIVDAGYQAAKRALRDAATLIWPT